MQAINRLLGDMDREALAFLITRQSNAGQLEHKLWRQLTMTGKAEALEEPGRDAAEFADRTLHFSDLSRIQ